MNNRGGAQARCGAAATEGVIPAQAGTQRLRPVFHSRGKPQDGGVRGG